MTRYTDDDVQRWTMYNRPGVWDEAENDPLGYTYVTFEEWLGDYHPEVMVDFKAWWARTQERSE